LSSVFLSLKLYNFVNFALVFFVCKFTINVQNVKYCPEVPKYMTTIKIIKSPQLRYTGRGYLTTWLTEILNSWISSFYKIKINKKITPKVSRGPHKFSQLKVEYIMVHERINSIIGKSWSRLWVIKRYYSD